MADSSLFLFQFRLQPWSACLNLSFSGKFGRSTATITCIRDQLYVRVVAMPEDYDKVFGWAQGIASAIVDAHAYYSFPRGPTLDVEPTGWIEVRNMAYDDIVCGYADASLQLVQPDANHPDNLPFRQAIEVFQRSDVPGPLLPILADFRAARRERSVYAAFLAYRVIEDIGNSFGRKNDRPNWEAMNLAFATSSKVWQDLIDHGTKARHLTLESPRYLDSVTNGRLLSLTKDCVDRWFRHHGLIPVSTTVTQPT